MKKLLTLLLFVSGAAAQTAIFPGGVATDNQFKVLKDRLQTTLSSSLSPSDTTLNVAAGGNFTANMIVTVGSEQIAICGAASGTLTVGHSSCPNVDGRGFGGTSAASAPNGAAVSVFVDAWHLNTMRVEMEAVESALGANIGNLKSVILANSSYNFPAMSCTSGKSCSASTASNLTLTSGTPVTLTIAPVPPGLNYTDANHWLMVSGYGPVLITGGNAVAGSASGTITFTPSFSTTGPWSLFSATSGLEEGIQAVIAAGGGTLQLLPATTYTIYAHPVIPSNFTLTGSGFTSVVKVADNAWPASGSAPQWLDSITNVPVGLMSINGATGSVMSNFTYDGNGANQAAHTFGTDVAFIQGRNDLIEHVQVVHSWHNGQMLGFHDESGFGYANTARGNVLNGDGAGIAHCADLNQGPGGIFMQTGFSLMEGNYLTGGCDEGLVLNGQYAVQDTVSNNVVYDLFSQNTNAPVAIHVENATRAKIIGNTVAGYSAAGVNIAPAGENVFDVQVIGNSFGQDASGISPSIGVIVQPAGSLAQHGTIIGNQMVSLRTGIGAAIYCNGSGFVIQGNQIRNNSVGIEVASGCADSSITMNVSIGNGTAGETDIVIDGGTLPGGSIAGPNSTTSEQNVTLGWNLGPTNVGKEGGSAYSEFSGSVLNGIMRFNTNLNVADQTALLDASKPGYGWQMDTVDDAFDWYRKAAGGSGAATDFLQYMGSSDTLAVATANVTMTGNLYGAATSTASALPHDSVINAGNYAWNYQSLAPLGGVAQRGYVTQEVVSLPSASATTGNFVGLTMGVSNASGATGTDMGMWAFNSYTTIIPGYTGIAVGGEIDLDNRTQGLWSRSSGLGIQMSGYADFGDGLTVSANDGTGAAANCDGAGECGNYLHGAVIANAYTGAAINLYTDAFPHTISTISNTTPPVVTLAATPVNCYQSFQVIHIASSTVSAYNGDWSIVPITCATFSLTGGTASGAATGGTARRLALGGLSLAGASNPVNGFIAIQPSDDSNPGAAAIHVLNAAGSSNTFYVDKAGNLTITGAFVAGGCKESTGTGAPNGAVTGSPCDRYWNKSGGSATTLYVKESGSATNTGWVGK